MTPETIAFVANRLPTTRVEPTDPDRPARFLVGPVRLAFAKIATPSETDRIDEKTGKPVLKYSACLLIPEAIDVALLRQEIVRVGRQRFGTRFDRLEILKPLRKQADKLDKNSKPYEGFGSSGYYMDVSTQIPPALVDTNRAAVEADRFYSGAWVQATVGFYCYPGVGAKPKPGSKSGVGANLYALRFLAHDEKLGGSGQSAASAYTDLDDDIVSALASSNALRTAKEIAPSADDWG